MDVILLERVAKLGQMGETVRVKDGYARNFLLPGGKALRATEANKQRFEGQKAELEARNLQRRGEAAELAAQVFHLPGQQGDLRAGGVAEAPLFRELGGQRRALLLFGGRACRGLARLAFEVVAQGRESARFFAQAGEVALPALGDRAVGPDRLVRRGQPAADHQVPNRQIRREGAGEPEAHHGSERAGLQRVQARVKRRAASAAHHDGEAQPREEPRLPDETRDDENGSGGWIASP